MAVSGPIIEIAGLEKRYRKVHALRGLDLEVPRGSVFGFLGPNGAGKTTTMKILMGLIRPTRGEAFVFGRDVRHSGPPIRSRIGYLPQDPAFHPDRTVREILMFAGRLYRTNHGFRVPARRVDELVERVGLGRKSRRRVRALSGGERQRLGIAQALVGDPELLILDEPSAGLDPRGRREVIDLIDDLRGATTVFYSTHILDDVERVSDAVAVVAGGRRLALGPLSEILSVPESVYVLRLRGTPDGLLEGLSALPWVRRVDAAERNGLHEWSVELREAAPDRLLAEVTTRGECDVVAFHPAERHLEDAYLEIVGSDDGD
jgi:ABC-2 type transport system ATP-binding protein